MTGSGLRLLGAARSKWALVLLATAPAFGSVSVTLSSPVSTAPVGTSVTFTASATDTSSSSATFTYQFAVQAPGTTVFSLVKDFYSQNTLMWADTKAEGVYVLEVNVRSSSGGTGSATLPVAFTSSATGLVPNVSPTQNPLVAMLSAAPCAYPSKMYVQFRSQPTAPWQQTLAQTCTGLSMNFIVAGMLPNVTYAMRDRLCTQYLTSCISSSTATFATGSLPASISFPVEAVPIPPTADNASNFPYILETRGYVPFAHDLYGNVVWYLASMNNPSENGYGLRTTNAGTLLVLMDDPSLPCAASGNCGNHEFLREYDLAGNLVRETNWQILGQQINALRALAGQPAANVTWLSHEGFRLPNGYTATILTDERVADQGQGPVDVLGDIVAVLDTNFQVVSQWDTFDYLDIKRTGLQNDLCKAAAGCPPLVNKDSTGAIYTVANDWTHMNSVTLDPSDGDLVISMRNQSWVMKIDYRNGKGDGHVVWTLGYEGSFALPAGVTLDSWFSDQHDAEFWPNGQLVLFDNGNYRISQLGGGNSRGQAWTLNTATMVATPVVNFDLGAFAPALGYATVLPNGDYDFGGDFFGSADAVQTAEFAPNGTVAFWGQLGSIVYRSIRLPDLYTQR